MRDLLLLTLAFSSACMPRPRLATPADTTPARQSDVPHEECYYVARGVATGMVRECYVIVEGVRPAPPPK